MSPVNVPAIGAYIREQREQAKISLRQLAQAAGVSNPYLSQIERGLRRPSADILQQIARGLRISAEALYVQAGFLEDRPPGPGVRDAVLADPDLTERQKQMLLEVYDSFRKEAAARNRTVLAGETVPADETEPPDETVLTDDAAPWADTATPDETVLTDDAAPAGEHQAPQDAGHAPAGQAAPRQTPGQDRSSAPEHHQHRVA
jgi:transcriptional regulator with XRE-family HTH domain